MEATEKLNDVSNGDSLPSQKEVDSFHLALGGYEKIQSIKNRILSKDYKLESIGTVGFAIGTASSGLISVPITMVSFGLMTIGSGSMGSKISISKMILNEVYNLVSQKIEFKSELTHNLKKKLIEFLPKNADFSLIDYNPGYIYGGTFSNLKAENNSKDITKYDAESFFKMYLNSKSFTLDNFVEHYDQFINSFSDEYRVFNQKCLYKLFFSKSIIDNGKWGTFFDHIFSRFSYIDRVNFLIKLKEGEFGNVNTLAVTVAKGKTIEENINNLINKIKKTSWDDRQESTKVFSKIVYEILVSGHHYQDQQLLFNIMENELEGRDRGEFGAGRTLRPKLYRHIFLGIFYGFTAIGIFALTAVCAPAGVILGAKIVLGGFGAMAFGTLSYAPHYTDSCSHESKLKLIKNAKLYVFNSTSPEEINSYSSGESLNILSSEDEFNISNPIDELNASGSDEEDSYSVGDENIEMPGYFSSKSPVYLALNRFNDIIKEFENFKSTELNEEILNLISELLQSIKYFENKKIVEVVFELNQANQDCPLFIIVRKLLNIHDNLIDKNEKDSIFGKINTIIHSIYKMKNESDIKEINTNYFNEEVIFNEDIFKLFVSNGLRKCNSEKEILLFSFQCQALIEELKEEVTLYKSCKDIFSKAVFNSITDNASRLYDLQKRNAKSYAKRRIMFRAFSNVLFTGLISTAISIIVTTSPLGIIALTAAGVFLTTLDFAGRKYAESYTHTASHRNLKIIKDLNNINESDLKIKQSNILTSLKRDFYEISKLQMNGISFEEKRDCLIKICENYLSQSDKIRDNEKIELLHNELNMALSEHKRNEEGEPQNTFDLIKNEIDIFIHSAVDKESILCSLLRSLCFILKLRDNVFSREEKYQLISYILLETCYIGESSVILKTKSLWTKDHKTLIDFLSVDLFLGFAIGSLGLLRLIPFVSEFLDFIQTQLPQFLGASAVSQAVINTACLFPWIYEWDRRFLSEKNERLQYSKNIFENQLKIYKV